MSEYTPHISLIDKSFSESNSNQYFLYLQLGKSGLIYTVFDPQNAQFLVLEQFLFNDVYSDYSITNYLNNILDNSQLLKLNFKKFQVAYINQRATLIPNAIFNVEELKKYHAFNFSELEEDYFFHDKLLNADCMNVFSIPDYITHSFQSISNVSFHHFSSAIIEASILNTKTGNNDFSIDVNVLPSSFQITVIKNQKLELYNSFTYQTSEDFIYYLLFVFNQLQIKPEESTINLSGEVEKNSAIYEMLFKYIKQINFSSRPKNLKYSYTFSDIPAHYYHSLFNQYLCE
ncbi:MAG: DUF3822 family protein [Flavobacteriales bacterium]|nr:DUF3822 family protein [Flavobacteriales bacterium]